VGTNGRRAAPATALCSSPDDLGRTVQLAVEQHWSRSVFGASTSVIF